MASEKVLVLGAKGMLGQELVRVFSVDKKYEVTGWDREEIDVTNFSEAERKIKKYAPRIIINAAAYNAVDLCEESEEEYQRALTLNAEVPKFLACLAKDLDAVSVHYSTDYVFDGENGNEGYDERAEPNPISKYGKSKWEGEKNVLAQSGKSYLIRLSKLFGKPALSIGGKKSFFEKMLEVAKDKSEVSAVDDEKSCFTYAPDLAKATLALIRDNAPYGIYHLPNEKPATWYGAALELFRLAKMDMTVEAVPAETFPRPARRPKYSALLNTKRPLLRSYTEALKEFLES